MSRRIGPAGAPGLDGLDGQAGQRLAWRLQHGDRPASAQRLTEVTRFVGATVRRVDVLVDAACVVGEHVTGRTDDGGRAPVVDRQGMGHGAREVTGIVDEEFGRCAGVSVDDLIVVAHPEAVVGRSGQQPDEEEVCRVEVLELVHQEEAALGLRHRPCRRIGQQDLDRPVDLLVEVDGARVREGGAVAVETLGDARRVGDGLFDQMRCGEAEPDGRQGLEIRGDRIGVGLPTDLNEALHQVAHGRLFENTEPTAGPEFVADPEPETVQGTDVEPRAAVDVGATLPHFRRRFVVVGQRGDGGRVHAALVDEVSETLGQHPGLSRARRGDHPGRPGVVVDRGQLIGSQIGRRARSAGIPEASRLGVPPMDHLDPRCEGRRLRWTPVDEDRGPVSHDDVGQRAFTRPGLAPVSLTNTLCGGAPGRLATVPPDGSTAPGVVIVGPDQELKALPAEFEMGGQLVDGALADLRSPQCRRVRPQFDDDRPAVKPIAVELLRHRSRVLQRGVVDDDPGAGCPVQGRFVSGEDDHTAAQLDRPV